MFLSKIVTRGTFSGISSKGHSFYDSLVTLLYTNPILRKGLHGAFLGGIHLLLCIVIAAAFVRLNIQKECADAVAVAVGGRPLQGTG